MRTVLVQPLCSEMGSELGVIQVLETYKRKIKSCQSLLSWVQAHAHLGSAGKGPGGEFTQGSSTRSSAQKRYPALFAWRQSYTSVVQTPCQGSPKHLLQEAAGFINGRRKGGAGSDHLDMHEWKACLRTKGTASPFQTQSIYLPEHHHREEWSPILCSVCPRVSALPKEAPTPGIQAKNDGSHRRHMASSHPSTACHKPDASFLSTSELKKE